MPDFKRNCRLPAVAGLAAALLLLALFLTPAPAAAAAPLAAGAASSSVIPCLPVGPDYLGFGHPSPYSMQLDVELYWSGTPTAASLVAYEYGAGGSFGRRIYLNGVEIGRATGTRNAEALCRGFDGREPLTWPITNLSLLKPGVNTIRITLDSTLTDKSWGLSRVQLEVTGGDVVGRQYRQVTVPSGYYFNWTGYQNEGS